MAAAAPDPTLIDKVVIANRILYDQGVVDGLGHVSVRHNSALQALNSRLGRRFVSRVDLASRQAVPGRGSYCLGHRWRGDCAALFGLEPAPANSLRA